MNGVYVPGVLAAGDDANRIFIENGGHHGRKILAHLTEGRKAAAAVDTGVKASTPAL